jgi:NTE family protein
MSDQASRPNSKALVLGGGGVAGIAWATGVLLGLEEGGVDLRSAELVVGTSAGAAVGAQFTSDVPLADLYDRQVDPARQVGEMRPKIKYGRIIAGVLPALLVRRDTQRFRVRIGAMARAAETVDPAVRRDIIAQRLPRHEWPEMGLTVAAIDAVSGEQRWFDAKSGVSLVDAVAASCAVPGVWPPIPIGDRWYYDGGLPSADNAHRASGYGAILILSPVGGSRSGRLRKGLRSEIASLEREGSRVTALTLDAQSRSAIGRNVLDPATRPAAARAGLEQGRGAVAEVLAAW